MDGNDPWLINRDPVLGAVAEALIAHPFTKSDPSPLGAAAVFEEAMTLEMRLE
jgi:hypothetical protein